MNLSNNTILITGGGSGIGQRVLRKLFTLFGNKIIIAGRRQHALEEVTNANPGMAFLKLDIDDPKAVQSFAAEMIDLHPTLNVLINNAGIMRPEDLKAQRVEDAEAIITTNLLGPVRLTAALLPHLQKQSSSAIINVSSGLAFVPFPATPTYSATKAALHSYTVALRVQLQGTSVEVIEIIPPAVATDLTPGRSTRDPRMMSLPDFITETMQILKTLPTPSEINVERVKFLRFAEATGNFEKALQMLSQINLPEAPLKKNLKMDISSYCQLVPSPVALVTGANKGIGFEISRILAEAGVFVWLAGRDSTRVQTAAASLAKKGLAVDSVSLDVTDPQSIEAAATHVQNISGALDILVNNAGIVNERRINEAGKPEIPPPSQIDLAMLRQVYETNVFGVFNVTKAFLPLLRKSPAGRIVNMSSGLGSLTQRSDPKWIYAGINALAYCSSKTAVNGVTVAFAKELKDTALKVNAADPGYCATDLNGHSGPRSATQGAEIAVRLATLPPDGPTSGFFDEDGTVPW